MTNDPNTLATAPDETGTQEAGLGQDVAGQATVVEGAPAQPQAVAPVVPEWFEAKKYGEPTPDNIARQAADYAEAKRAMHKAQQERAELERKLKMYEEINPTPYAQVPSAPQYAPQPTFAPQAQYLDPATRQRMEALYPGKTPEEVLAEQHMIQAATQLAVAPLAEEVANLRMERMKSSLREKDKDFQYYEQEFDMIMNNVPVTMRTRPDVVRQVQQQAKGIRADDIFAAKMSEFTNRAAQPPAQPAQPPRTVSTPPQSTAPQYEVSEAEIARVAEASGEPIETVRTWYLKK